MLLVCFKISSIRNNRSWYSYSSLKFCWNLKLCREIILSNTMIKPIISAVKYQVLKKNEPKCPNLKADNSNEPVVVLTGKDKN